MDPGCKEMKWLEGLKKLGIQPGLRNITTLLKRMGNPQLKFRTIHVAGTDGKGSVCAIAASILKASGFKTGLFTSPQILSVNELMKIDGADISDDELKRSIGRVRHFVDDMRESEIYCTYFEVLTAVAFDWFQRADVDIAVIEVGMGGKDDATNVLSPDVCIINNVSLEHTSFLGDTIGEIATAKAGILKPSVPCVTSNTCEALDAIRKLADEVGCDVIAVDLSSVDVIEKTSTRVRFDYEGEHTISLPGTFSAVNSILTIEALKRLPDYKDRIEPHLDEGLASVRWPCRMENFGKIIIDVTHTSSGSEKLVQDVADVYGKVTVVIGMLSDKDADGFCRNISRIASKVYVTEPSCDRAMSMDVLYDAMVKYFPETIKVPSVGEAAELAVLNDGPVLFTGSFYTAGEVMEWKDRTSQ